MSRSCASILSPWCLPLLSLSLLPSMCLTTLVATRASAAFLDCGQPISKGPKPVTSDALRILQVSVGSQSCMLCVCDITGDGDTTVADAQRTLKLAVGISQPIECDACQAEATIGANGGQLTSHDGLLTLIFPAGALDGNTSISIEDVGSAELPDSIDPNGNGNAWRIGPDGLELDSNARIELNRGDDFVGNNSVIGAKLTLLVGVDDEDVEVLPNQDLVVDRTTDRVTARARLSRLSLVGAIPLEVTTRINGFPHEVDINDIHPLPVRVEEAAGEDIVHVNKARYIDDNFGSWMPVDGEPVGLGLTKVDDGEFEASFDYVCVGPVQVFYAPRILVTYDVTADIAGPPQDVEHEVFPMDQVSCD